MDANGDGSVTRAEMDAVKAERKAKMETHRLEKFDTNGDGTIDEAEKEAAKALRKEKRAEHKTA